MPAAAAAAARMGRHLFTLGGAPEVVLCSLAQRTRETLALVLPWLDHEATVHIERGLYETDAAALLARVRTLDAAARTAMIIGHNLGLEQLARSLAGWGAAEDRSALAAKYPTAALAVLCFEVDDWAEIAPGAGTLTHFATPRTLLASDQAPA